ncbi:hypothetical protein OG194_29860 [Streptomyces sp. NBC_01288]|uniref:hypothetical protein n=1 Tax=Streptomyces sp. NBC_01288 TaxID=2903814 RepID=UPI002E0D3AC2|nr:hypothetical protein OG194_29860 [Streptomyces sp. NBC_01288]
MADDDAAARQFGNADRPEAVSPPTPHMQIDIHYVDSLPVGRAVMPVETEGHFAWLVVHGHISHQAGQEMVAELNHIVRSGLWCQNWRPPQPG